MTGYRPLARPSVLASAVGSMLLLLFWASYLLGPAALTGIVAHLFGAEPGILASLAVLSFAATILALKLAAGHFAVWSGT